MSDKPVSHGPRPRASPVWRKQVLWIAIPLLLIAGGLLSWLLLWRDAPSAQEAARLAEFTESNRALARRIEQLKRTLREAPDCPPGEVRRLPDGTVVVPPPSPWASNLPRQIPREAPMSLPDSGTAPRGAAPSNDDQTAATGSKVEAGPKESDQAPSAVAKGGMDQPDAAKSDLLKPDRAKNDPKSDQVMAGDRKADEKQLSEATLADSVKALASDALTEKLERATALIVTAKSIGTGFFISERLLITNRHVVDTATSGRVHIASRSLESARRGTVLHVTEEAKPGAPDFALVRLDDGTAPDRLEVTSRIKKLAAVTASGYPGLIVAGDVEFRRLLQGDLRAAPDLNLTQGAIQSLQTSELGVPIVIHTAAILEGNSGGPLVDSCARVVGVNTFIAVDQKQSGRVSFAQGSKALVDFMKPFGGGLAADDRPCRPA